MSRQMNIRPRSSEAFTCVLQESVLQKMPLINTTLQNHGKKLLILENKEAGIQDLSISWLVPVRDLF